MCALARAISSVVSKSMHRQSKHLGDQVAGTKMTPCLGCNSGFRVSGLGFRVYRVSGEVS